MIFFSNALTGRLKPEYRIINDRLTGSKQYRSAHSWTSCMVLSAAYEYQRGHFPLHSISCAPDTERTWISARTARRKGKSGTELALYSFSLVRSTALWYDKCIHKAVHHEHRRYSHRSAVQAEFWSDFIHWADHAGADESIHNLHTSEQHCRPNGKGTASCMG